MFKRACSVGINLRLLRQSKQALNQDLLLALINSQAHKSDGKRGVGGGERQVKAQVSNLHKLAAWPTVNGSATCYGRTLMRGKCCATRRKSAKKAGKIRWGRLSGFRFPGNRMSVMSVALRCLSFFRLCPPTEKKTNDTNKFSVAKQRESAKIRREKRYLVYTENYFEVSSSWYILAYCIKLKIRNS